MVDSHQVLPAGRDNRRCDVRSAALGIRGGDTGSHPEHGVYLRVSAAGNHKGLVPGAAHELGAFCFNRPLSFRLRPGISRSAFLVPLHLPDRRFAVPGMLLVCGVILISAQWLKRIDSPAEDSVEVAG